MTIKESCLKTVVFLMIALAPMFIISTTSSAQQTHVPLRNSTNFHSVTQFRKPDGTIDIQAAMDSNFNPIFFPAGTFSITDPIEIPSGKTLIGSGMRTTKILGLNKSKHIFTMFGQSNVTIRDMEITHDATTADFVSGHSGTGIYAGVGGGGSHTSKNCVIDSLWVHNCNQAGLQHYQGSESWSITNCVFENNNKANLTTNGARFWRVIGNEFGPSSDDSLAFNVNARNCTVSGNVFRGGGNLGGTGFAASAIKLHGRGCVIDGNTFEGCHIAIAIQAIPSRMEYDNLYGAAHRNIISNNRIAANENTAITLDGVDLTIISHNIISAIDSTGIPKEPMAIEKCGLVLCDHNIWEGRQIVVRENGAREISFENDTFSRLLQNESSYEDAHVLRLNSNVSVSEITFTRCRFAEGTTGVLVKQYGTGTIDTLEVIDCKLYQHQQVACVVGTIAAGVPIAGLTIDGGDEEQRGVRAVISGGQELWVTRKAGATYVREVVTAATQVIPGTNTVVIFTWTPANTYTDTDTWLVTKLNASLGVKRAIVFGAAGSTVNNLRIRDNRLLQSDGLEFGTHDGGGTVGRVLDLGR